MKTAFRRLLAAAPAFSLSACMLVGGDTLVTPGGAEDFPNTVNALGRIAAGDLSSSGQWTEQVPGIPVMPEIGGLDSLNVTPPLSRRGLARAAAEGETHDTIVDQTRSLEFLLLQRVYVYLSHETPEFTRKDTVICRYLGTLSPSIGQIADSIRANPLAYLLPLEARGAIRSKVLPQWQSYRLSNTNGRGPMDWAEYVTHETGVDGSASRKRVRIYGPDSAYARPDAVPEEYEVLTSAPGGDTLEWVLVRDADWDRRLWLENASGVVDIYRRVFPASEDSTRRKATYARAELSGGIGGVPKQLQYLEQRWLRNGRVVTFDFRGSGSSGTLLLPNDSARMTVDTVFALRDSMIRYSAVYNLRLGPVPEDMQGHALRGYSISKYWRRGPVFHTALAFTPSSPVSMGQANPEGAMDFTVVYAGGDTVRTEGRRDSAGVMNLSATEIKGTVKNVFCVILNVAGKSIGDPVPWSPGDPPCW